MSESGNVVAALESLRKSFEARSVKPEPEKPAPKAKVVQLRIWPEAVRGVPNSFLRSALFAAVQGKTRRYIKGELLGALDGVSVKFTGMQLDQSDLDVWEQIAHLARLHPLGNVCHFKANAFLKAIGRDTGKANYEWFDDTLARIGACEVEIKSGTRAYNGILFHGRWRDEQTREYKIALNPTIAALFCGDDWTGIQFEERLALKGKPLALWLHGFYSSHAKPFPMKVETLRDLSGSATKNIRHFKANLKTAFADLGAVTGMSVSFDGNLAAVKRIPTKAQGKHLARKTPRKREK